jgi:hypothetical protein
VQTGRYAVDDSGLLTGPVDWVKALPLILQKEHPNAVVAIFVGNYANPPLANADGTLVVDDGPEFFSLSQQRAEELSQEARESGATMYLDEPTPDRRPDSQTRTETLRRLSSYSWGQSDRRRSVLAGPHGSEVLFETTCGRQLVRSLIDGIHLTDEGARLYGQKIPHVVGADRSLGEFQSPVRNIAHLVYPPPKRGMSFGMSLGCGTSKFVPQGGTLGTEVEPSAPIEIRA